MRATLAVLVLVVSSAVSAVSSASARSPAIRGAAAARTPKIGAGNLPFYLDFGAKCSLVWNQLGCTFKTSASTDQTRRITCATTGSVAALVPLAGGVPYGSAVSGVLPHLDITGVADADVSVTSAGWTATESGPVYESSIECHAALLQQAAYDGLLPFVPTNFTAARQHGKTDAAAATTTTKDQGLGTDRPEAEVTFNGGGSRVETVAVSAKTQTDPFFFQSPMMALPTVTAAVISNMAVNSAACDVAGGQPFALVGTVYADRVALDCEDVGDNECGSKLCNLPAMTTEILVTMVPFSLGSSDALRAGISVSPAV